MTFLRKFLRTLLNWLERRPAPRVAAAEDPIGADLRAAIAADAQAKAANVETYQARVEAMVADFFARYGERHVRRPT